jgi:plastocyanin
MLSLLSIRAGVGAFVGGAALTVLVSMSVASASGVQTMELRDDCDPATFDAALQNPNACVGKGDTTFNDFIAQLQKDQIADAWRFSPDKVGISTGTPLVVTNRGGETHTFNCVTQFGGGIVPLLNTLSGNNTPAVLCATTPAPQFVAPGASLPPMTLAPGSYKFQCLIHPWMRTVVTVGNS